MKKNFILILTALLAQYSFAQTETFDIVTYTPPKDPTGVGWKKDVKQGVVNYTKADAAAGTFCVITLFASSVSSGDAQKDFTNEWKELVVTPYNAVPDPQTETQTTADGWKVVSGAAPIKLDGNDVYVILAVASGFGKTMSVRTFLNDQAYTAEVDALFATMKLDKTKTPTVTTNTTIPPQSNGAAKFGLMIYTPPPGWSHQVFGDGVVFKPLDLPADEHLAMQIMQPISFSGTIEQALTKTYDEAAAMYNSTKMHYAGGADYQKTDTKRSFQGWEYIRANGGVQVENGTPYKTELGLDIFIIKINNRFERIAILQSRKNCSYSRYYASDRLKLSEDINNFLYHIQFSDGEPASLKPGTAHGNGITGVWQGISMSTNAGTKIEYKVYTPIFLTNGQAYFGSKFPTRGLYELDTRIPAELYRRDWGTYTFSNGRGVLRMPYGDIPLRMEGDKLVITSNQTDHRFYQLPSVDGARFNGTYTLSGYGGKIASVTFTPDGRFTDNGAIRVMNHEYVECIDPAINPGSGTYEVKDYTILFNYSDGRKLKLAFLGAEYDKNNSSPSSILMSYNEDRLQRQ